jgi:hypothetical protein
MKYKMTQTIKEYSVKYNGWNIVISIGFIVSNSISLENDRFLI